MIEFPRGPPRRACYLWTCLTFQCTPAFADAKGTDEAHLLEEVILEGGHHARAHRSC